MASLLALLSHPTELSEVSSNQTAKSVIFVLDEFDLFTTHSRQTLLYNLFDIAQARKAPIAVLGLTTRIDVVESLEKRVKSRFSHRYVYLSHPRSPPNFWDICKTALTINQNETGSDSSEYSAPGQAEFIPFWNTMVEVSPVHLSECYNVTKSHRICITRMMTLRVICSRNFTAPSLCLPSWHLASCQSQPFRQETFLSRARLSSQVLCP
jgi:hypothetical protein